MPTCENCGYTWTWKESLRKSFTLAPEMECPNCGENQYQTQKSKMKSGLLNIFITLPLLINIFLDISGVLLLSLIPALGLLVMSLYPFLMEISSKEEYINFFEK